MPRGRSGDRLIMRRLGSQTRVNSLICGRTVPGRNPRHHPDEERRGVAAPQLKDLANEIDIAELVELARRL
jgi:hypothetical protein